MFDYRCVYLDLFCSCFYCTVFFSYEFANAMHNVGYLCCLSYFKFSLS